MFLSWTYLLISIPSIIVITLLMLFYYQTLLPLKRLEFYKKQGLKTVFMPLAKRFESRLQNVKEKGDYFYEEKHLSETHPDQKVVVHTFGSQAMVCLQDTEYIKEFNLNQTPFVKAKFNEVCKPLLGNGLIFVEGEKWKLRRKMISSSFHYEFIHGSAKLIQDTAREFLDKIEPSQYKNFNILDKMAEITGEVVGRIFFGRNLNKYTFEGRPITLVLADLMTELGKINKTKLYMIFDTKVFWLPIPYYRNLAKRITDFRSLCIKIVQDRKTEKGKYSDLLDALLAQQRESEDGLTDDDIVSEFLTFFMAGMDTTARLSAMMLYNLTQHPEWLVKLRAEQDMTYNTESEVSIDTIQKMNAMNCMMKETLRHHSPASTIMFRETTKDLKLKDIYIKKGSIVKTDPFVLFFSEKYFEEPHKFKPERWENPNPKMDSYAFTPFSAGPRNCIGQHLSILEAKIIVSEFMNRFDFKVIDGYKLRMVCRFLYEPFEELKFDLTNRQ